MMMRLMKMLMLLLRALGISDQLPRNVQESFWQSVSGIVAVSRLEINPLIAVPRGEVIKRQTADGDGGDGDGNGGQAADR